ncbi:MAG: hypothetical protein Q4C54_03855 [Clostridia bacterium]|nr:hypothetical protein [Clostridia bacterium]
MIDDLRFSKDYYHGCEGEEEVIISLDSNPLFNIHLWIGYLDDILNNPDLSGIGWNGFTRDYHQLEGAFSTKTDMCRVYSTQEYLEDLLQYKERNFDYPETK